MTDEKGIALAGGTLIDGNGRDPLQDAVVIVRGSIIQDVGKKDKVKIPADCQVVDVSGQTVMPGMIDCHVHFAAITASLEQMLFTPPIVRTFQSAEMIKRTLHAGFTTVRDTGGLDIGFRQAVEIGLIEGPRLLIGALIGQTGGHFDEYYPCGLELKLQGGEICDGVPAVQRAARRELRKDVDLLKVATTGGVASPADSPEQTEWTMEELKAIVYEATARGKVVIAHACQPQGVKNAIRAGVWSVEHGYVLDDEAIELFLETGTFLVPTLFIVKDISERGEEIGLPPAMRTKMNDLRRLNVGSFKRAAAAGVKIAVGSDIIDEGSHGKNACELELMVRHGFTPMQAIVAATKTASKVCRIAEKTGTLETKKFADLLVVEGNPLDDITILQDQSRLLLVMKEGKSYVNKIYP